MTDSVEIPTKNPELSNVTSSDNVKFLMLQKPSWGLILSPIATKKVKHQVIIMAYPSIKAHAYIFYNRISRVVCGDDERTRDLATSLLEDKSSLLLDLRLRPN